MDIADYELRLLTSTLVAYKTYEQQSHSVRCPARYHGGDCACDRRSCMDELTEKLKEATARYMEAVKSETTKRV